MIDTKRGVGTAVTVPIDTEINVETIAIARTDIEINVEIEVTVARDTAGHQLQEGDTMGITTVVLAEIGNIDETRPINLIRKGVTITKITGTQEIDLYRTLVEEV